MIYVIPMYTLLVQISKIPLPQDSQIHEVQIRKSYLVPFEPIEWLVSLQVVRTDLELGKVVPNSLYLFWSVSKYNYWRAEKSFATFDRMWFQGEKEFEKSQTQSKSVGSELSADVSQSLLPQTKWYKIAIKFLQGL